MGEESLAQGRCGESASHGILFLIRMNGSGLIALALYVVSTTTREERGERGERGERDERREERRIN
jgi:hypothetical protein